MASTGLIVPGLMALAVLLSFTLTNCTQQICRHLGAIHDAIERMRKGVDKL